jgi:putative flippase GtrA
VSLQVLIIRYVAFAILAITANLAIQRAVLTIDNSAFGFALALLMGTAVGLIVKYLLDKRWIFYDRSTGLRSHKRKFPLYFITGVLTTAIFWSTEIAFWLIWQSDTMREIGALLGLSVGYVIKYNLDRQFVFPNPGRQLKAAA